LTTSMGAPRLQKELEVLAEKCACIDNMYLRWFLAAINPVFNLDVYALKKLIQDHAMT